MEQISKRMFWYLDCTGYSYNMIKTRREYYRSISDLQSKRYKWRTLYAGSKGDGTTKPFENDRDILYFISDTVCIEDPASVHLYPDHVTVFTLVNTQAGYCLLELLRRSKGLDVRVANSLVTFDGKTKLSSEKIGATLVTLTSEFSSKRTGPAQTVFSINYIGLSSCDKVYTIPCHCLSILKDFVNRSRPHDWPPSSLRQTILQMTGNLVATGPADSETVHLEWRYCFNEIEMLIMETLNDTQLKLYKLMTIINNDIFKEQGHSLTSFIIKNIVFWLVETHPQFVFRPEMLYNWVCEALKLLKQNVEANNIPYYIIPGRNLLKEKVKESERPRLIQVITDVIVSGPAMLFECESMRKFAYLTSEELVVFKRKMEILELCRHKCETTYYELRIRGRDPHTDPHYRKLCRIRRQILRFGWPTPVQHEIDDCEGEFFVHTMLLS